MDFTTRKRNVVQIAFHAIGEFQMHYHSFTDDEPGPERIFNCAIRDRKELLTERVELHRGEELHWGRQKTSEYPLLRFDNNGLWAWMKAQELWYPIRKQKVTLSLDREGRVRVRFEDDV